jgi:hypothetical protein
MSRGLNARGDPGSGLGHPGHGPVDSRLDEAQARHERALAEVDRELRALLSEIPSGDFEGNVLARIARDEEPRRASYTWLAAAAALVLAAGLLYALTRSPAPDPTAPRQVTKHGSDILLPPVASQPRPAAGRQSPRLPPAGRLARHETRRPQPEVIVPLNQMEAVRRLVRAFNEGRIEASAEPLDRPVEQPKEIVVEPVLVDPIPLPALDANTKAPEQPNRGA